ncbi:MAG TPA: hypothetical protein EYP49_02870 [Anaerolineae bacterium]|nr:hypothetical protein [Anaerolineae bacterium]
MIFSAKHRRWLYNPARHQELERFVKFALVGILGMVIDLTILNVLHGLLGWHLLVANSISDYPTVFI